MNNGQLGFGRVIFGIAIALGIYGTGARAFATTCQGDNATNCWAVLSGPNYSQVVVGTTPGGATGIACAVLSPQPTSWGGTLHCYLGIGTSGASIRGRGGQEAQNPGPFDAANGSMRMSSLAISPGPSNGQVTIWVLRSDGVVFNAVTAWPLAAGGDPRIFFYPLGGSNPPSPRSIAYVANVGIVVTDTSNNQWKRNGTGWAMFSSGNFMVAGHAILPVSYALQGSSTSTTLVPFSSPSAPQPLPGTLADSSANFFLMGTTVPLAVGPAPAWATLQLTASFCGGVTPCVIKANRNTTTNVWGPWSVYSVAADSSLGEVSSIQDGYAVRRRAGEIWAIHGPFRLSFYAP
jgi:hypothetical protein